MVRLEAMGEHRAVEIVIERVLRRRWRCKSLEPGDDAACAGGEWSQLIVKIDGGPLSSLMAPWMSFYDVGWQAVAAAASDLAAKAARPIVFTVSLGVSRGWEFDVLEQLVAGAADSAEAHGGWLAGGDTNSSPAGGWIDVAAVGVARNPIPLSGAKPGDRLYITVGRVGLAGAVLDSLTRGTWREVVGWAGRLFEEFSRPRARVEFAELVEHAGGCVTAATDSSDGIAFSLWRLAKASGVEVRVESLPSVDPLVREYSARMRLPLEQLVFYGGQEYEIVFTVSPSCEEKLMEAADNVGLRVERIGSISAGPPRVMYKGRVLEERGWDNFTS